MKFISLTLTLTLYGILSMKTSGIVSGTVIFLHVSLISLPASAEAQEFKIRGRLHMDAFYGIHHHFHRTVHSE